MHFHWEDTIAVSNIAVSILTKRADSGDHHSEVTTCPIILAKRAHGNYSEKLPSELGSSVEDDSDSEKLLSGPGSK